MAETLTGIAAFGKAQETLLDIESFFGKWEKVAQVERQKHYAKKKAEIPETFEPFSLSAEQAQEYGIELDEGWNIELAPGDNGEVLSTLISPDSWKIKSTGEYVSPEGEVFTQEDMEKFELDEERLRGVLGRVPFKWEAPTLEGLESIDWATGKDVQDVLEYAQANPEQFLAEIGEIGRTQETVALLHQLGVSTQDIDLIFGPGQQIYDVISRNYEFFYGSLYGGYLETGELPPGYGEEWRERLKGWPPETWSEELRGHLAAEVPKTMDEVLTDVQEQPEWFFRAIHDMGKTPDSEILLQLAGLSDTDIEKFWGERYEWEFPQCLPFIGGKKWPDWAQTIVGGETGEGGILAGVNFVYSAVSIPWIIGVEGSIAKIRNNPADKKFMRALGHAEAIYGPNAVFSDEVHRAIAEHSETLPDYAPWAIELSNPAYWAIPTAIGLRAGLLPVVTRGGLSGIMARGARVAMAPIAGVEQSLAFGLKWTVGFPLKYGVIKPFQKAMRRIFESGFDQGLEKQLATKALRGRTALRTVENLLEKDYKTIKKTAQKNLAKREAEGGPLQDAPLKAAEDTIRDIEPLIARAAKEVTQPPNPAASEAELRTLGQKRGYSIYKVPADSKLATEKGYAYRITGQGSKVYAHNLEEATNFIEIGSLTGLGPRAKAGRLAELATKKELSATEKARMISLSREVGPQELQDALRMQLIKARPKTPIGTVRSAANTETRGEAVGEINREFYDAIKESALDPAATAYYRNLDFEEFIRLMPDIEEMKLQALTTEVKANLEELYALVRLANEEIESIEKSLAARRVTSEEIASRLKSYLEDRDITVIGTIHQNQEIFESCLEGRPIRGRVAAEDIDGILDFLFP